MWTTEWIQENWKTAVLCSIYKKGDTWTSSFEMGRRGKEKCRSLNRGPDWKSITVDKENWRIKLVTRWS